MTIWHTLRTHGLRISWICPRGNRVRFGSSPKSPIGTGLRRYRNWHPNITRCCRSPSWNYACGCPRIPSSREAVLAVWRGLPFEDTCLHQFLSDEAKVAQRLTGCRPCGKAVPISGNSSWMAPYTANKSLMRDYSIHILIYLGQYPWHCFRGWSLASRPKSGFDLGTMAV